MHWSSWPHFAQQTSEDISQKSGYSLFITVFIQGFSFPDVQSSNNLSINSPVGDLFVYPLRPTCVHFTSGDFSGQCRNCWPDCILSLLISGYRGKCASGYIGVRMGTKRHCHLTMEREIVSQAREIAGLIPFSRFVESLLRIEIDRRRREEGETGR